MSGTQQAYGYTPAQQQAQLLADTDISQYQNPYQQQVIDMAMRDIGSAQQQALMQQGAQAQQARAFGGSRQGVAEAETRLGYGQQAADAAARIRQQGFQQAQQAAMFDVGQRAAAEAANVAARTGAAQYGAGARTAAQLGNINRAQQVQAANAAAQMQAAQYAAQERAAAQRANLAAQQSAMGTRLGCSSAARGAWPAGIRDRAGDPAAADAARPIAADVAAVAHRRGARRNMLATPAHLQRRSQRHWRRSGQRQTSQRRQRRTIQLRVCLTIYSLAQACFRGR